MCNTQSPRQTATGAAQSGVFPDSSLTTMYSLSRNVSGVVESAVCRLAVEFRHSRRATPASTRSLSEAASAADLSISEAASLLSSGDITAVEIVDACLERVDAWSHLNALVDGSVDHHRARAAAQRSDERRAAGQSAGALDGIPLSIKDNFAVEGITCGAGSRALEGHVPPYTASAVHKLTSAGAIIVGKANLDEFAMGSDSTSSANGAVVSPWSDAEALRALRAGNSGDRDALARRLVVPGGSSGGSAVSVATGAALGSLGSDTGGSVRQPASFCGVVGLKPTYGRVSRWGLIAYASSLDTPGVLARTVADAALLLDTISGLDPRDSTSIDIAPPTATQSLLGPEVHSLTGIRVGVPVEYRVEELGAAAVELWSQGIAWLRDAGAEVVEVSLPHTRAAVPAYYVLAPAEAASNLSRYDGVRYGHRAGGEGGGSDGDAADVLHAEYTSTRSEAFGEEVQRRILVGNFVLSQSARSAYYDRARAVRDCVAEDFASVVSQLRLCTLLQSLTPRFVFCIVISLTRLPQKLAFTHC